MRVALAALHDAPLEILRLFSAQVNNLLSSFKFMLQHSSYIYDIYDSILRVTVVDSQLIKLVDFIVETLAMQAADTLLAVSRHARSSY